ncbi:MAG: hypothetical protein R3F59_16265 [Myxococcota bacterium]
MTRALPLCGLLTACTVTLDTKTDTHTLPETTPTTDACTADPAYGEGTCDADLSCGPPDIDSFRFFDTQAEAEAFYEADEAGRAPIEGHPPRAVIPSTDPRWPVVRDLLDEGWASYTSVYDVADLAAHDPALVLIEDDAPNAYVIADYDADLSAFIVIVHDGVLDVGAGDDAMLGLMLHELQHAVGLHLIHDNVARTRKYYLADGIEPIGADQADDPAVREPGEGWKSIAEDVGYLDDPELHGLPLFNGSFYTLFLQVVRGAIEVDPAACQGPAEAYGDVVGEILAHAEPLSGEVALPAGQGIGGRADDALARLRDECVTALPNDFPTVMSGLTGLPPDDLLAALPPDVVPEVQNAHVIDGIAAIEAWGRGEMRAIEGDFEGDLAPWTALRYFSTEEDADDHTVPVMRALGRTPWAQADMLLALTGELGDACDDLLATGAAPAYGADLTDEHHATCWRVDHVRALSEDATGPVARRAPARPSVGAEVPRGVLPAAARPGPPPAADPLPRCVELVPGQPLCPPGVAAAPGRR